VHFKYLILIASVLFGLYAAALALLRTAPRASRAGVVFDAVYSFICTISDDCEKYSADNNVGHF